jgi:hypothetical protein
MPGAGCAVVGFAAGAVCAPLAPPGVFVDVFVDVFAGVVAGACAAGVVAGVCVAADACATGALAEPESLGELPVAGAVDCACIPAAKATANPAKTAALNTLRLLALRLAAFIRLTSSSAHTGPRCPASLYRLDASMCHFGNKGKERF